MIDFMIVMMVINHQRSTTTFQLYWSAMQLTPCNCDTHPHHTPPLVVITCHHTSPRAVTRRQVIIGDHDGNMSVLDYLNGASMKQFSYIE